MQRGNEGAVTDARRQLVACGRDLLARGLLSQTSGNLSIRVDEDTLCITPSAMPYDQIEPDDIVVTDVRGNVRGGARRPVAPGARRPSSETPLHCLVYASRPDAAAIVHTHSPQATTLAVLGLPIPAVHYMIAAARTTLIQVAAYATYGTDELARNVRDAFGAPARAVLIANHGVVTIAPTLAEAASIAESVETLAGLYYRALAVGEPKILTDEQMAEVLAKHDTYDQR